MDIEMDQMDGIAATREIINVFPNAKVLIVSKYGDEQLVQEAYNAGACGHVIKETCSKLARFSELILSLEEPDDSALIH